MPATKMKPSNESSKHLQKTLACFAPAMVNG